MSTLKTNPKDIVTGKPIEDREIEIKNPEKHLDNQSTIILKILNELKDPNTVGPKKDKLKKALEDSVRQYILMAAACINNNIIETDPNGIIKAEADPKKYKGVAGHLNSIAKKVLKEQKSIEAHKGATLSETELAKLIETPYNYRPAEDIAERTEDKVEEVSDSEVPEVDGENVVEIECTDGSTFTVDKENSAMYVEGENEKGEKVTFRRRVAGRAYTWYAMAKNIAISFLNMTWGLLTSVASFGFNLTAGAIGTVTGSTTHLFSGIGRTLKGFGKTIADSHRVAKKSAELKGYHVD